MAKSKPQQNKKVAAAEGWPIPTFEDIYPDNDDYDNLLYRGMMYAHHAFNNSALKSESLKWIENSGEDATNIKKVSESRFATFGKVAWLSNNGAKLKKESLDWLVNKIQEFNSIVEDNSGDSDTTPQKKQPTIQDYVQAQVNEMAAEIDAWVDEFITDPKGFKLDDKSPMVILLTHEAKALHASKLASMYEGNLAEINEAIEGKCEQLKEAYSKYNQSQLKKLAKLYEKIIFDANHLNEKAKVERKTKKKKPVSIEKRVQGLKYKEEDHVLGLVSIKPADILGKKVLWTYDTKKRKLIKYVAQDEAGLGVEKTSITGYSITESSKKTIRKPDEHIKTIKGLPRTKLEKHFESINSVETKMTSGRINPDTILLKAF
jgi:hypothetical protein